VKRLKWPFITVRHVWFCDAQNTGDFALFQLPVSQDFEYLNAKLRTRIELAGIVQPQIGKDVAGAFPMNIYGLARRTVRPNQKLFQVSGRPRP
jgi:hypothetical protein